MMKLLANFSYGYQIMNRSQFTVTKYLKDNKTHGAINNSLFKCLSYKKDQLFEVELVKSEKEHKEPNIVEFFILRCVKMRSLELY